MKSLKNIKLLALDVDGVLTDGSIIIGTSGELAKRFNAQDGLGISASLRKGLKIALITGRHSEILLHRAKELGITLIYENVKDKKQALLDICQELNIKTSEVVYMGDDLNDLPALMLAGVGVAPQNAAEDVKAKAQYVTQKLAGQGAVREVIEMILKEQGLWETIVQEYMQEGQGDKQ